MASKKDSDVDVFKKNRIIYFTGEFDENKAQEIAKKLFEYELEDPTKDIVLFIDSHGGVIDSYLAIHDTIRMLRSNVATFCLGRAMSAGALLLMAGSPGKRFISPNSRTLIHELTAGTCGRLQEIQTDVVEFNRRQKIIADLILQYTKISKKDLEKYLKKDTYFSAEETIKYGLADKIVKNYDELFGRLKI